MNAEDTAFYKSVTMRVNCLSLDCLDLVICCRLSGTRDEESHYEGSRGTQTCWTLLERATT